MACAVWYIASFIGQSYSKSGSVYIILVVVNSAIGFYSRSGISQTYYNSGWPNNITNIIIGSLNVYWIGYDYHLGLILLCMIYVMVIILLLP